MQEDKWLELCGRNIFLYFLLKMWEGKCFLTTLPTSSESLSPTHTSSDFSQSVLLHRGPDRLALALALHQLLHPMSLLKATVATPGKSEYQTHWSYRSSGLRLPGFLIQCSWDGPRGVFQSSPGDRIAQPGLGSGENRISQYSHDSQYLHITNRRAAPELK